MNFLITFFFFICVYGCSAVDIMPELKRNILNFGYGVNFKYEGILSHSFDRFHVVAKFELPKVENLRLTTVDFGSRCCYLASNGTKKNSYLPKTFEILFENCAICGILQKANRVL